MTMRMKTLSLVCALLAGAGLGAGAQTSTDTGATPKARTSAPAKDELSRGDKQFLKHAAEYGMAEIEASKLAETKATSADVKSFAKQMLEDHQKASDELKQLAESKGYKLPDSPSMTQRAGLKMLASSDGDKFDKRYAERYGVKAHESTVKDFRKEASEAKDSDVKAFAEKLLPKLEQHLSMAQTLEASVNPTAAGPKGKASAAASAASGTK
jgi:putative membrane protein